MKEKLEKAIESLTEKAKGAAKAIDAQQYAQGVLNLANALVALRLNPEPKEQVVWGGSDPAAPFKIIWMVEKKR